MAQEAEENPMAEISELPSEPSHHQNGNQNGGHAPGQNGNGVHQNNGLGAAAQLPEQNGDGEHDDGQANGQPNNVESGRRYAQLIGWGYCIPDKVITNHDLEQIVETSDEWIRSRTGIEERRVASDPKETTASLGAVAARRALEVADVEPS